MKYLLIILSFLSAVVFGQASHAVVGSGSNQKDIEIVVPFGYSPEAQAAIDNMVTTPSQDTQDNMAAFVDSSIIDGNYSKFKLVLSGAMAIEGNALSDWITGLDSDKVGSMTHVSGVEWQSPASGGAINSNFNASTTGIDQDNWCVIVYVTNVGGNNSNQNWAGARGSTYKTFLQDDRAAINEIQWSISFNQASAGSSYTVDDMDVDQLYAIEQSGPTSADLYEGGSSIHTNATASTGVPDEEFYWFGSNETGTLVNECHNCDGSWFLITEAGVDFAQLKIRMEAFDSAQAP